MNIMQNITKYTLIAFAVLSSLAATAQQEPHYTQYMYNMGVVNPAYMINEPGIVQVGSLYRAQWVGLDGAPKTANIFGNIPLNEQVEIGINYTNDQIGDVATQNIFNVNFAYKIKLNYDTNLSFGLKMGVDNVNLDFSQTNVSTDAAFQNQQQTSLAIGAGAFLFKEKYYVGFSSPNLIPYKVDVESEDSVLYREKAHFYLMGGYVFNVHPQVKLKPSAVTKIVFGAPITTDVSLNALYDDRFELGLSYRVEDAVSVLAGFNVTPDLRIGYAYDFGTSRLRDYSSGSHEIVMTYVFDIVGLSRRYASPRFY